MAHEMVAFEDVSCVTDRELIARLRRLVRDDQTLNARLLVHLGEVDARGLYREHAYASMFSYCVEALRMSEAQAYLRIQAARLGRQFPLVLQLLAEGALHLTAIKLLGPHLTTANHADLLQRASGKGKREIELLVAAIAPKPDVPNRIRRLPDARSLPATRHDAQCAPTAVDETRAAVELEAAVNSSSVDASQAPSALEASVGSARAGALQALNASPEACDRVRAPSKESLAVTPALDTSYASLDGAGDSQRTSFTLEAPRPRASSKPLSPGRYKLELTAGQALHDKLTQLTELLRHQVPDGDLAVIVERAVDLLIDDTMKQRFAQTRRPKKPSSVKPRRSRNANSRYIPRAVIREVHARDAGQCTFVSSDGKRCSERGFLELHHHDRPYARGGDATVENLRLVCRAHNALFAERDYGRTFMRSKLLQMRAPSDRLGPERVQV